MFGGIGILMLFLLIGEAISGLGLALPGNVIGMLLLTAALSLRIVRLEQVQGATNTLLDNLAFLFVPPSVGVMVYFNLIGDNWPAIVVSLAVGATAVLLAIGLPTQWWMRRLERKHADEGDPM